MFAARMVLITSENTEKIISENIGDRGPLREIQGNRCTEKPRAYTFACELRRRLYYCGSAVMFFVGRRVLPTNGMDEFSSLATMVGPPVTTAASPS